MRPIFVILVTLLYTSLASAQNARKLHSICDDVGRNQVGSFRMYLCDEGDGFFSAKLTNSRRDVAPKNIRPFLVIQNITPGQSFFGGTPALIGDQGFEYISDPEFVASFSTVDFNFRNKLYHYVVSCKFTNPVWMTANTARAYTIPDNGECN